MSSAYAAGAQIAQMAAANPTTRVMGHKPYLAHRTISYHLYPEILPKLEIAVRSELRHAFPEQAIT